MAHNKIFQCGPGPKKCEIRPRRKKAILWFHHDGDKEKVNKYTNNCGEPIKYKGSLSKGEDRDDYTTEKYVERETYDGKWAERDEGNRGNGRRSGGSGGGKEQGGGKDIPSETNIEEMDKFLNKVKKDKREEMLERNKEFLKNKE